MHLMSAQPLSCMCCSVEVCYVRCVSFSILGAVTLRIEHTTQRGIFSAASKSRDMDEFMVVEVQVRS